jgi:hypothetical protein
MRKWEKEKGKEKNKGFPSSWAGGIFGPPGASARAGARLRPSWPGLEGATAGNGAVARAHTPGRGGGVNGVATTDEGGGRFDRSPVGGELLRRFSAAGPVLWRGGGGEARASAGDHGGGINLACGGLWRPVHGGEAAGAVAGHDRRRGGVPHDRESVAELRA